MRPVMSIAKRFAPRLAIAALIATSAGCLSIDTLDDGVGVLVVATGNDQTVQTGKTAAVPLVVRAFDNAAHGMQFVEKAMWIDRFNINYFLGVDGISLWFVLLTAFITMIVVI